MRRHLAYLKYVLRHKWFVYVACRKCGVGFWQALVHDWHKFIPSEWLPYARTFYNPDGSKRYQESPEFARAWNAHQKRGRHHWQYWLLTWDRGDTEPLEMPECYWREMVADWFGAGRAITGKWGALEWYQNQGDKIRLHPLTRPKVENLLWGAGKELWEESTPPPP